jgi:hypothetical protein
MKPVWIAFILGLVFGGSVGIWIIGLLHMAGKPAPKIEDCCIEQEEEEWNTPRLRKS